MGALLNALARKIRPNLPSLDLFGPGPLTNLGAGDEQALTNAVAHVWFGIAVPMVGFYVGGQHGLRVSAAAAAAFILIRQVFFHGKTPGPETRTDLLTGLLPLVGVVLLDLWK